MKPSKQTLEAALEFGPAILDGSILQDQELLDKLYKTFFNKKIEEINDYAEYIGKFLSNAQLYQLVEHLLALEGGKLGIQLLRQEKTLGKYLFLYEIQKSPQKMVFNDILNILITQPLDYEKLLQTISFPDVVNMHYKSLIMPLFNRINANGDNTKLITEHVLFNILKTIITTQLSKLNDPAQELLLICQLNELVSFPPEDRKNATPNQDSANERYLALKQETHLRIFQAIIACALPTEPVIHSTAIDILKFKNITGALSTLHETLPEEQYNKIVHTHLDDLLKIVDLDALLFALQKLKPAPASPGPRKISLFQQLLSSVATTTNDTTEITISEPNNFRIVTLDMDALNYGDTLQNIRSRFYALISSIKNLMELSPSETYLPDPLQTKDYSTLMSMINRLSIFRKEEFAEFDAKFIVSHTKELYEILLKNYANLESNKTKLLFQCIKNCLINIVNFVESCKKSQQQENPENLLLKPPASLGTN
jgi:hypothetical protein